MSKITKAAQKYIDEIKNTGIGMERNMYPSIKSLLVSVFGHRSKEVYTDIATPSARLHSRNMPDVQASIVLDDGIELDSWLIVEAKDEPGVFRDVVSRDSIFAEKYKYITSDTQWFIMVDPETWICRQFEPNHEKYVDTFIDLRKFDVESFVDSCKELSRDHAVMQTSLQKFRNGEESWIASIDLDLNNNKKRFYDDLKKGFGLLVSGCFTSLKQADADYISLLHKKLSAFEEKYGGSLDISFSPFRIRKPRPSYEKIDSYRNDVKSLRRMYSSSPKMFRLVWDVLMPLGYKNEESSNEKEKIFERVALETSSLLLSRILMLRFFEDHDLFGVRKYLCNGGVKAFNEARNYFNKLYPSLVMWACQEGAKYHEAIFTETDHDWVFEKSSVFLSEYIEQVLYYLSFYNFKTVREDILNGIYQKVIDLSLRKKHGQIYTLPQVAHYLIGECLKYVPGGQVMDPACGTGTFLVEYFELKHGDRVRRNVISYQTLCDEIIKIKGNDLNPIASTMAQIQMLWRLLPFVKEMKNNGFPDIEVTSNDALESRNLLSCENEWDELDSRVYDMVVGNPPYVRPERQTNIYGKAEEDYFDEISVRSDLRDLFVYKALKSWLKNDGVLGFVLSLSFLDSNASANLRKLFAPGGEWRLLEIIDLEEIAKEVFPEVNVNPILLIAQKHIPVAGDSILLRVAHRDVLRVTNGDIDFDFTKCESVELPYSDIFTSDGRILTRLNRERKIIVDKIAEYPTWIDIAKDYWVKKEGRKIVEASLLEKHNGWEHRKMIGMGAAFRRKIKHIEKGMPVYKGENIAPCQVLGLPQKDNIDVLAMDDPSYWRFPDILSGAGYAFQRISLNLTATYFDPMELVFLNTATLFFPVDSLGKFPFDFLVMSSVFQWYFAISQREAAVSLLWSNVYSRTVNRLPWSEKLVKYSDRLNELRKHYLESCRQTNQVLLEQLYNISSLETLGERGKRDTSLEIVWSRYLENDDRKRRGDNAWHYYYYDLFDYFGINNKRVFDLLQIILPVLKVNTADPSTILSVKIPASSEGEKVWRELATGETRKNAENLKNESIRELDMIVADAFGLTGQEIEFIRSELVNDCFLKKLKPLEPYVPRALRGFLAGLDSSNRYQ